MDETPILTQETHELVARAWKEADADPETALDVLCEWTGLGVRKVAQILVTVKAEDYARSTADDVEGLLSTQLATIGNAAQGLIYDTGMRRDDLIVWKLTPLGREVVNRKTAN
jgi:hypothetical protein